MLLGTENTTGKIIEPIPITQTNYDALCASGGIDENAIYQVYRTDAEVEEAMAELGRKAGTSIERTYNPPETSDMSTHCTRCIHEAVCAYREDFIKIMKAAQQHGIVANIELFGGYQDTIDLMSEEYLNVDISCKHYDRKKKEVVYRGI